MKQPSFKEFLFISKQQNNSVLSNYCCSLYCDIPYTEECGSYLLRNFSNFTQNISSFNCFLLPFFSVVVCDNRKKMTLLQHVLTSSLFLDLVSFFALTFISSSLCNLGDISRRELTKYHPVLERGRCLKFCQ